MMCKREWLRWVVASITVAVLGGLAQGMDREVVISVYQGPCKDGDFSANLGRCGR